MLMSGKVRREKGLLRSKQLLYPTLQTIKRRPGCHKRSDYSSCMKLPELLVAKGQKKKVSGENVSGIRLSRLVYRIINPNTIPMQSKKQDSGM